MTHSNPGYASGSLYYLNARKELIATSLDVSKGRLSGESRVIAAEIGFQPSIYWGAFTVAENGTVVYSRSNGGVLSVLTWFDRAGKILGQVGDIGLLGNPAISPDGNLVAVDITDVKANNVDIWIHDLRVGSTSRFTFDPSEEVTGIWSHDGRAIVFRRSVSEDSLILKSAQGLQTEMPILKLPANIALIPNSWSPDDTKILSSLQPGGGGSNFVLVSVSDGKMAPFLASGASETNGQISPNGKWVAYASNESGDWEIYVTSFPSAAGKWQVSRGGGTEPRWRSDGNEIFYIGAKGVLTAVPVNNQEAFSAGNPSALFQIHGRAPISSADLFTYDVTRDGKRFLVNRYAEPEHIAPLNVVLNAATKLRK